MKLRILLLVLALVQVSTSMADHNFPLGSVGALSAETDELYNEVNYSSLACHVKSAVNRFNFEVRRLVQCVVSGFTDNHIEDPGVPASCGYQLQRARNSFRLVEHYLYDTTYDYPHVFQRYLHVRRALYAIYVTQPCSPGGCGR